jgi:hypothetical protein
MAAAASEACACGAVHAEGLWTGCPPDSSFDGLVRSPALDDVDHVNGPDSSHPFINLICVGV